MICSCVAKIGIIKLHNITATNGAGLDTSTEPLRNIF